jgi:hypothetical protein
MYLIADFFAFAGRPDQQKISLLVGDQQGRKSEGELRETE